VTSNLLLGASSERAGCGTQEADRPYPGEPSTRFAFNGASRSTVIAARGELAGVKWMPDQRGAV